jgi:hypothetical protein
VPTIHFGTGTANILQDLREAGGDVIGADWRIPLDEAWDRIGPDRAIQGNLDPTLLLAPLDRMLTGADDVLERAGGRPGHIFNLGHGILPSTPVDHVQALAQHVHRTGWRCVISRCSRQSTVDRLSTNLSMSPSSALECPVCRFFRRAARGRGSARDRARARHPAGRHHPHGARR